MPPEVFNLQLSSNQGMEHILISHSDDWTLSFYDCLHEISKLSHAIVQ